MTHLLDGVVPCGIGHLSFAYLNHRGTYSVGRWHSGRQKVLWCLPYCLQQSCFTSLLVAYKIALDNILQSVINGCIIMRNSYYNVI